MLLDVILDTLLDGLRLLPFLFFTYLLMEFLEHRTGEAGRVRIGAARRSGPVWGALFGIIPQCGFSAAASGLYAPLCYRKNGSVSRYRERQNRPEQTEKQTKSGGTARKNRTREQGGA